MIYTEAVIIEKMVSCSKYMKCDTEHFLMQCEQCNVDVLLVRTK